jgi:polysaccharide pyruvyl transferase CsaB
MDEAMVAKKSLRNKVLIAGYYGAGNLGDEAILESMLGDLRALRADLAFFVTSWDPAETSRQYGVKAIHWKDINALLDAGQQADLVILGGGGLFQDYWGLEPDTYLRRGYHDITSFGSLPLLAKLLGVPCMIYAVGLGPLQSDLALQHTRLAFERCQVATLRDEKSLALLQQTGFRVRKGAAPRIEILPDPVFALTSSPADEMEVAHYLRQRQVDPEAELVGVALRYWDRPGPPGDWLPYIAEGLNRFLATNPRAQVILVPFQITNANPYTDDGGIHKKLYQFMAESWRVHLIEEPVSPRFAQALIKRCSVVLGMRLHALILGINAGTPIVALPYDPKVSSLMKQAGLEAFCCASLTPRPEDLAATLQKAAYENRDELRFQMDSLRAEWAPAARKNAVLAVDLLEQFHRKPVQFGQQFALEQLRLLEKVDEAQDRLKKENLALQSRVRELDAVRDQLEKENLALQSQVQSQVGELDTVRDQLENENHALQSQVGELERRSESLKAQLDEIQSSNFWKLARLYYHLMGETPLRYLYRFAVTLKREGPRMALRKTLEVIRGRTRLRIAPPGSRRERVLRRWTWGVYLLARPVARVIFPRAWRKHIGGWMHQHIGAPLNNAVMLPRDGVLSQPDIHPFGLPTAYDVICFPIIEWEHRFQRPQQLATRFAQHGHRVFYLHLTFHDGGSDVEWRQVAERIFQIQLPGPTDLDRFFEPLPTELQEQCLRVLDDFCAQASIRDAICMVQLPFWTPVAVGLRDRYGWKIVYDCMDEHSGLTILQPEMLQDEVKLAQGADLVLTSSQKLWDKHAGQTSRLLMLRNATDFDHFNRPAAGRELGHLPRPIIGYYGAIMEWFDAELVSVAAATRPDWSFVLIGSIDTPSVEPLRRLPNVHFLGEQPYSRLPAYLQQFDVCLIPFKLTPIIQSTNPVKFYEYLSAGKPVVATLLPELLPYQEFFYPAHNAQELVSCIEQALREDSLARKAARIEWARQQTWQARYELLSRAIEDLRGH